MWLSHPGNRDNHHHNNNSDDDNTSVELASIDLNP